MTAVYIIFIVLGIFTLVKIFHRSRDTEVPAEQPDTPPAYPYQPEVEYRLPDRRITTYGYAARNPWKFSHWRMGPENVYGEYIDRGDWEAWYENYYGISL